MNKVSVQSDGSDFILDSRISRLQIDDVNKFCLKRLRFRPRFWEPGQPRELGHGYPVLYRVLHDNVLAGVRIRKRASRVCTMYHCCGRV
jgi:hypothetical protein